MAILRTGRARSAAWSAAWSSWLIASCADPSPPTAHDTDASAHADAGLDAASQGEPDCGVATTLGRCPTPTDPPESSCTVSVRDPRADCEAPGCDVLLDAELTCTGSFAGQMALAIGPERVHVVVPTRDRPRLFGVDTDGGVQDALFPLVWRDSRIAVDQAGTLWAHGTVELPNRTAVLRRDANGWAELPSVQLARSLAFEIDQAGRPVVAGMAAGPGTASVWSNGEQTVSEPGETELFTLGPDGAMLRVQRIAGADREVSWPGTRFGLELPMDGFATLWPGRLPALEPGAPAATPLGLLHMASLAGATVAWVDAAGTHSTYLDGTATEVSDCPGTSCMARCDRLGTQAFVPAAARDARGDLYVAFLLTTYDQTLTASRVPHEPSACDQTIVRDDNTHELRVLHFADGSLSSRSLLALDAAPEALQLAAWSDELAVLWQQGASFRVLRLRVGPAPQPPAGG